MNSPSLGQHCPDWATALCAGFAQIFLQRQPLCGVLCLLAIVTCAPTLLGGALLGGVAGLLTAQRRDYPKAQRQAGLYSYNGILLGLLLSYHFEWSALLPLLIIASAGISSILIHHWLKHANNAYTAPFVGIGWGLLYLDSSPASGVSQEQLMTGLTLTHALFSGIAQVMLLDHPLAGVLIVLGLWLSNWRAAVWALTGSLAGLLCALWQHDTQTALSGLAGYNPALAALALSQQSRRIWLPLLGIIASLLITPALIALGLPLLTAPFVLGCWLVLACLRLFVPSNKQSGLRIER
ncbi:urea transporter [Pseudomonas saxonica]|uniref:urea transporter n=1 Tax=Pseudomonas saxonica TaxID=2600598 RepID=UPI002D794F70|nr:urea transporter [Pseudomonas saxonica]WRQ74318.1 urea transporter [Pseudomonas saxonica]